MAENELLPCPFCGCAASVDEMDGAWVAGCDAGQLNADDDHTCRANGIGFYHVTREGAIAAWNRRHPSVAYTAEQLRTKISVRRDGGSE